MVIIIDKCVVCGQLIPEGRQVCPNCKKYITNDIGFLEHQDDNNKPEASTKQTNIYLSSDIKCGKCGYEFDHLSIETKPASYPGFKKYIFSPSFCPRCESEIISIHINKDEREIYVEVK